MFKPLMVYEVWANFSLMTNFPQPCENQQRHWHLCFLGFLFLDYLSQGCIRLRVLTLGYSYVTPSGSSS